MLIVNSVLFIFVIEFVNNIFRDYSTAEDIFTIGQLSLIKNM